MRGRIDNLINNKKKNITDTLGINKQFMDKSVAVFVDRIFASFFFQLEKDN